MSEVDRCFLLDLGEGLAVLRLMLLHVRGESIAETCSDVNTRQTSEH